MRYAPAILLLIAMPVLAANVWKWRDANGVVHYSDQPVPGAEQVNIDSATIYTPTPTGITASTTPTAKPTAPVTYTNVEIWKPSVEETIANTAGQVGVAVRVEPALGAEHRLALYMDGRLVPGFPERGMEYQMSEVDRGAHTLVLAVIDVQGKKITTSAPVEFFVHQPSILTRPR